MKASSVCNLFLVFILFASKELSLGVEGSSKDFFSRLSSHTEAAYSKFNHTKSRRSSSWTRQHITTNNPQNMSESERVHVRWKEFERDTKKWIEKQMKKGLQTFLRMRSDAKVSGECSKGIMALIKGVRDMKSWAFRMLDSNAKIPSGILDGTLTDLGEYDECLAIQKLDGEGRVQLSGQYCAVKALPHLPPPPHRVQFKTVVLDFSNFSAPDSVLSDLASNINMFYLMTLHLGLCVPSTCSVDDVHEMMKLALKEMPLSVQVDHCEKKEPFQMSGLQMSSMSVISALIVLSIIGTWIDVKTSSPFDSWNKMCSGHFANSLKCFSVHKNIRKLFQISSSKENFGALNGLRVLSMVWVVLAHTYGFSYKQGIGRMKNAQNTLDEVTFGTIINAWIIVDTFFVLGAFLVSHSNLKSLKKDNGQLNYIRYYVHRVWRLTPPVAGCLLIMFLLPLLGSGPLFKDVIGHHVGNCEKYWWQALVIPINTWTHFDDMCLLHTWYIASDMHFYFLAPLILVPLYKWPWVGFTVMIFLSVSCMGVVAVLTVLHDFYPTLLYFTPNETFTMFQCDLMYFRPYPHMGAYCIGLALGYIVLHHTKVDIQPLYQILGWCAAISCNIAVLYSAFEWNRGNIPTKAVDVTYAVFHRTAWAMGIAWIIYICIAGKAGLIGRFLSWEPFVPLARLSYSAYILHFPVLWMRNGLRRKLLFFHHYDIFYEFLATLVLTLCLSFTFHLLFEAPFLNLEETWFPKDNRKLMSSNESEETIVTVAKIDS